MSSIRLSQTKQPNTYTLSKALAEDIVYSYRNKLPIVVLRPSNVTAAVNEPYAGYYDGIIVGMNGMAYGILTGLVRTIYSKAKQTIEIISIDFVVNATIVSVYARSTSCKKILFFNCTISHERKLSTQESIEKILKYSYQFVPHKKLVWYPNCSVTTSYYWHIFCLYVFQLLPALLFDGILILMGKKTR